MSSLDVVSLLTALGCGLNAGVFFAFSSFVMPALDRAAPAVGLAAMRSINRTAVTPPFMAAFLGTAVACAVVGIWGAASGAWWAPSGAALYLVGAIGVTAARNVPLNDALEGVAPERWPAWSRSWTAWNHARTAASLAAAVVLAVAAGTG